MPNSSDWLPGRREQQLAMAKNWLAVLATQAAAWNVPAAEVTELQTLTTTAEAALTAAQSSERTPVITANCKAAFDALVAKMRFIKSRYFLSPPLADADFTAFELKPKDTTHTPVPAPTAQEEADITRPGVHLLELHLRPVSGSPPDPHRSDYGYRVYWTCSITRLDICQPRVGLKSPKKHGFLTKSMFFVVFKRLLFRN
jgi:hypothetical protein